MKKGYKTKNKRKHLVKVKLLKMTLDKAVNYASESLFGLDLNFFGSVGKGIEKFDKNDSYLYARKATYLAKQRNPSMTTKQMSDYHYKIRFNHDVKKGTLKFGWVKSLLK